MQLWDWDRMEPAWRSIAVATSNPMGPGAPGRIEMIQHEDYEGNFYAIEYQKWPLEVQAAFCKENGRPPKLADGSFALGPSCEELAMEDEELLENQVPNVLLINLSEPEGLSILRSLSK